MFTSKRGLITATFVSGLFAASTVTAEINYDAEGGMFTVNGSDTSGVPWSKPGTDWIETGRLDMGWGGAGGGNLEAYSSGHAVRPGQFKFIYGGSPTTGKIVFTHFNGSGWTDRMVLTRDGRLGIDIGSSDPCADCKVDVNGKIRAEEVIVEVAWPDYVFKEDYSLMSLSEVDRFITANGHLPGIPKADQIEEKGVSLGEVSKLLLEKIEELTLHMIQLEKRNDELEKQLALVKGSGN